MKKFLLILPLCALAAAGCTPTTADQRAVLGGIGGAAVGAAVSSPSDRTQGALIGAAVGVAASTLIGPAPTAGQCYYRNSRGERFIAPCQ
ncbi:MAG: glycine zipper 2TM domain-containing protein [Paracoccaceae bacterium]|nr:MAG: glycine zipper 2TM domain-containing protein [Paracoccaceae bacterium]